MKPSRSYPTKLAKMTQESARPLCALSMQHRGSSTPRRTPLAADEGPNATVATYPIVLTSRDRLKQQSSVFMTSGTCCPRRSAPDQSAQWRRRPEGVMGQVASLACSEAEAASLFLTSRFLGVHRDGLLEFVRMV